jgi:hypothetical protein
MPLARGRANFPATLCNTFFMKIISNENKALPDSSDQPPFKNASVVNSKHVYDDRKIT